MRLTEAFEHGDVITLMRNGPVRVALTGIDIEKGECYFDNSLAGGYTEKKNIIEISEMILDNKAQFYSFSTI